MSAGSRASHPGRDPEAGLAWRSAAADTGSMYETVITALLEVIAVAETEPDEARAQAVKRAVERTHVANRIVNVVVAR